MSGTLFISYRRSQRLAVDAACALLQAHGVTVWLDRNDIDELADFPEYITRGLAHSHAVLIWWSRDYADSRYCVQEFLLAWQMARRHPIEEGQRVWILNPEVDAKNNPDPTHILAGDLANKNFLEWPPADAPVWAEDRCADLASLIAGGLLSTESLNFVTPERYGRFVTNSVPVGRGAQMMHMHTALFPARLCSDTSPTTAQLYGMAGVGKSALADHYAKTFAAAYPGGIWWFDLSGLEMKFAKFKTGKMPVAQVLEDVGTAWLSALEEALRPLKPGLLAELSRDESGRALDPSRVRERMQRQLAGGNRPQPYLWVLNQLPAVNDRSLLDNMLSFLSAPTALGRTVITCRDKFPVSGATAIAVPPLSLEDGRMLLASYLETPEEKLREQAVIAELVAEVGAHPLVLTVLGEHARTSLWGLSAVLRGVRENGSVAGVEHIQQQLAKEMGTLTPNLVAAFEISFAPLDRAALDLLTLASVCATHSRIPMRLLEQAFRNHGKGHRRTGADKRDDAFGPLTEAPLRILSRASLITQDRRDLAHVTATVHPLVAEVRLRTLKRKPHAEQQAVVDALLSRLLPLARDPGAFVGLRGDAPHANAFLDVDDAKLAPAVSNRAGVHLALGLSRLQAAGGYPKQALAAARKAVTFGERFLDGEDPDHLRALIALYSAQADAGDLGTSAAAQQALLPVAQRVFGATEPDALELHSLLAATYYRQRRLIEAEQLQRDVLAASQGLPAERSREVRSAMSALAATLYQRGYLDQARALQEDLLRKLERESREVAAVHPEVVIALHDLAVTLLSLGHVEEAIQQQKSALLLAQNCFGDDHPATWLARSTLADALAGQRNYEGYEGAIPLYEKALKDAAERLGPEHPECLVTLSRLIGATGAIGRHEAADDLQRRFVSAIAPVLPAAHPDTLASVEYLARALNDLGQPIGHLAPLLAEVLKARLRDLGKGHLETVNAFSNLALALVQAGEPSATVALRRGALEAARALAGDPDQRFSAILDAHMALILLLDNLGQPGAARAAETQAVEELKAMGSTLTLQ